MILHFHCFFAILVGCLCPPLEKPRIDDKATVLDLSLDFEIASLNNPGAAAIQQTALAYPSIRTSLVLENGKIVAQYARSDVDPNTPFQTWSTTKSWMSLLVGLAVEEGLLDLDETLGEIFTSDTAWSSVNTATEIEFKKSITIRSMLTMSSGLVSPPFELTEDLADGGVGGGANLSDSLAYPIVGEAGVFNYLIVSNILSYVFFEKTGMTPREYAAKHVFGALGIDDREVNWWQNEDGMEYSYHGLELTPIQMAKFGQLYLQHGLAGPNAPLVSSEWITISTTPKIAANQGGIPLEYGYLFWIGEGTNVGFPNLGNFYCAVGLGGQALCIHPELNRVSVQQSDVGSGDFTPQESLIITSVAFDKTVSFDESSESGEW